MSIFAKPISQLGSEDLEELLAEEAVENVRLEFKLEVPAKDETLKKLSSFANTFGGYVVIGAEADSSDGRIVGLPGVDRQPGYKQKMVEWCFGGVAPPLTVEVSDPIPTPSRELRYIGPLLIEMMLQGIRGVPWIYFVNNFRETGPASELDDDVLFSISTTSEALNERPDGIATDILRHVFFAMNWPDVADSYQKLGDLVKAGYKYNNWSVPENLRV